MTEKGKGITVLTINTLAFTVCFACWMMNGVLVTFLVDNGVYDWNNTEMGWLFGVPVLTGALLRLPVGILTDKYGGRVVFSTVMLLAAIPMYLMSIVDSYWMFFLASLGFGIAGSTFAVGIAYTSVWFEKGRQGTALGIFGAGNAGAALTSVFVLQLLAWLTDGGSNLDGWRMLPIMYSISLVLMTGIFLLFTFHKRTDDSHITSLRDRLQPLKNIRVWRFGMYYFLVFGGFVALSQWLIPYYVNAYSMTIAAAGMMTAIFSFPSGVVRALGGYMSDQWGARKVMYLVLGICLVCSALLIVPQMDIESPGKGIMAAKTGVVTQVSDEAISVDGVSYSLKTATGETLTNEERRTGVLVWPRSGSWQEPVVQVGDVVVKKQLLARGVTHIYFQANVWIFTGLVFIVGFMMGIGKAAVYKHIPDYFPRDVGVVGGVVGVLGGLGGFICPILFGYMLESTGIWTTSWMFFTILSAGCLWWMHSVIQKMMRKEAPNVADDIEHSRSENQAVVTKP